MSAGSDATPSYGVLPANEETLTLAVALILKGQAVAFPTETVYGLGANALDERAVREIYRIKGRPSTNPLIVHCSQASEISRVADLSAAIEEKLKLLGPLWPGPLTVVLPKNRIVPAAVSAGGDSVGVRIPAHPVALQLIKMAGVPLAAPSANVSTAISPTSAQHVLNSLGTKVPLIIDGGVSQAGIESTVLSLTEKTPVILRPGIITKEQIEELLGLKIDQRASAQKTGVQGIATSPGQDFVHYAPSTPAVLISEFDVDAWREKRVGFIAFSSDAKLPENVAASSSVVLSKNRNLREVASGLYAAMHYLDTQSLDLIVIDECAPWGTGAAIMDRLQRAVRRHTP